MVHLGITVDEATLRRCCETDRLGTTAKDTVNCARSYGLQAQEASDATWSELVHWCEQGIYPIVYLNLFPLDALWVMHAVVIETVTNDTVVFLDPLVGRRHATIAAFEQAWQMNRRRIILITTESVEE